MTSLNPNRTGLVLALLVGAPHLLWALLVALGWAQAVVDFVLWMHFLRPVYSVDPFKPSAALLLVGVSATSGYVTGFVFAVLWNRFHRQVAVPMNSLHRGSGASGD